MSGTAELELRIAISRAVFINGELVATQQRLIAPAFALLATGALSTDSPGLPRQNNSLAPIASSNSVPNVAQTVGGSAAAPVNIGPGATTDTDQIRALVVQNGPGNFAIPDAANLRSQTIATVLQNTLDNQSIRTLTTLDASSSALGAFRQTLMRGAVSEATTDFLH